ncbi:MAG: ABC transporter ATP-binding protein/permease, partial [Lachnospiraceae bacterium]|nr:ABC transporter ATP-binding protein/permease [Lachnospiraceae bacterium]
MSENLKKMLSYYKPYQKIFWADMFFAALSAAAALMIPLVVRYVTSTLIYLKADEILHQILYIAVFLLVLLAIDCYSRFFIGNYGHVMGAKIEYNMRAEIFDHMQKLSFSFYDDAKVGQLMSRITTDLFDITELLHHGPENIILSVLKIAGAFAILVKINGALALAAFIVLPFMFMFAYLLNRKMRRAFRRNREKIAEINGQIEDNLSGIRVVKSFANEEIENQKFQSGNDGFLAAKKSSYRYMGSFQAGVGVFTTMIQVSVILTGSILIAYNRLNVSDLITFLLYIGVFTDPIRTLVDFTEQFQNGYTGFERFREIMNIMPDITDAGDAVELMDVEGNISFEGVSFHYKENKECVLNNINLEVKAGSYMALVGSSGAGKTTLCSLIPRFYDVTGGTIRIDGKDIRHVTLKSLRSQIGIVQQDVYLFAGTIYENIAYGKPGASREEVIAAAKNANAHEFIMSFPDGYDTDIGQRGIKLSGGQKQRLSIARVFLKNPPILIFDEATSALDNESEKVVQDSLEILAKN